MSLRNQFDIFVTANADTIRGATKFAAWGKNLFEEDPTFDISLINQPGTKVWPIVTATFVLLPKDKKRAEKNKEVLKLFGLGTEFRRSGTDAVGVYTPQVKTMVRGSWKRHFADAAAK